MAWESKKLRELLLDGWQVKGFQSDFSIKGSADQFDGGTDGVSILLQKEEQLAVVTKWYNTSSNEDSLYVNILTDDR